MSKSRRVTKSAVVRKSLSASNGHWDQWIEPGGVAYLSQMFLPSHFVIKSHGPGYVGLHALAGDDMQLSPGTVRATFFRDVRVENLSATATRIEFEFLPLGSDFSQG